MNDQGKVVKASDRRGCTCLTEMHDRTCSKNKTWRIENITICLEIFLKVLFPKPTDLLIGRPELASLVNIDLTGLLSIGLSELFANAKGFDASLEDPSLTA